MNSNNETPAQDQTEPAQVGYEDSLEGMLQYHADLSMYYAHEAKNAKTQFKRDYFKKKQVKNNKKLYKLLVRTPNKFNPLMKYITPPLSEQESVSNGFVQVADENGEFPTSEPGELTISIDSIPEEFYAKSGGGQV